LVTPVSWPALFATLPIVPDDLQAQEIASLASPLPYILQTFFPLPRAWGFLCTHLGKPAIMPVLACFIPLPAPSARQRGAFPGAGSFRLEWLPRSNDEAADRALPQSAPDLRQGLIPRSEGQVRGEDPSSISTNRPEPPIFARRAAGAGGIRTGGPTLVFYGGSG